MLARSKRVVMIGSLAAAGLFGAWLSLRSTIAHAGRFTDGATLFDPGSDAAVRFAVWETPVALAGAVNSAAAETRPALARGARSMVFAVGEPGLNMDLYLVDVGAEAGAGAASEPRPIEVLNTGADECAPAWLGGDLYFASDRPGGSGGLDLYRARWDGSAFGPPERLDGPANSSADDCDPAPRPGTEELVFASNRDGKSFDLYSAHLGVGTVAALESLATSHDERDPAFSPDGRALFFASDRDREGSFDLWRSFAGQDGWLAPASLDSLNSDASERGPCATSDGFTLYFTREVDGRASDVLSSRTLELYRLPTLPVSWIDWSILASLLALALMAYLAERWPGLDTIYKCFLASMLVHIALLLWFRHVWLEGHGFETPEPSGLHRVRLIAPNAERMTERDGRLRTERADANAAAEDFVPERIDVARSSAAEPAPPGDVVREAVGTPAEPLAAAPERAQQEFAPSASPAEQAAVELDSDEPALERRGGSARELALAPMTDGGGAPKRGVSEPTRADVAHSGSLGSESPTGLDLPVGDAPSARTPRRASTTATDALRAGSDDPAVALASPRGDAGEGAARRTGAAPSLAIDALAIDASTGSSRRASGPGSVERYDAPTTSTGGDGTAPPALSSLAAGVAPPANESGPRARTGTATDALRTGSNAPAVALAAPQGDGGDAAGRRGGAAPGLALDALAGGASASASQRASGPAGVEPFDGSSSATNGRDTASAPPPALSSLGSGVAPPATSSGPRARGATSVEPQGTGQNPLVLQDREAPTSRIGGTRETESTTPSRDLLASLAPAAAGRVSREPAAESSAPERFSTPRSVSEPLATDSAPTLELPLAPPSADREKPVTPPRTSWEHTPYKNRAGEEKARALEMHGGSAETEQAVERGLAYLARIQRPGGEWGDLDALDDKYGQVSVGKTGLALLAFLGAGHTHVSSTVHSPVVQRAVDALLGQLDPGNGHFGDTEAYSHGIATFAIAECLALSRDERLRAPLTAAVAHILEHQSKKRDPRFFGGWGYFYSDDRTFDRWPRTSITVWQVMALESARLSGVAVPDTAFDAARQFLENARDEDGDYYRYNHDPERLGSGYPTLPASTPAALFALSLLGEDIQGAEHASQRAFVLNRAPESYRYTSDDAFVHRAQGNLYFWYYGTLAMFRAGGGAWASWNEAMKKTLLPAQEPDGSWRPIDIYARYARDDDGDRSYTTAMCVLSLEIYYRYFLPLLKVR
jgi:hypothetical protein